MKIVIFKSPYKYCDFMCDSIADMKDVVIVNNINFNKKTIKGICFRLLNRINSNRFYRELVKRFVVQAVKPTDEEICFVSFDSSGWSGTQGFLFALKEWYPNAKTALIIYNSIQNNYEKIKQYKKQFDYCFSFDPYDCERFDLHYFLGLMPLKTRKKCAKKYDVCFVGNDKGRYEKLKEIYSQFTAAGLKCYFHITSEILPQDGIDQKILFRNGLSFDKTIEIEAESRCVLDFTNVCGASQGISLRILEAVYCNSKIITNNILVQEIPAFQQASLYYDELPSVEKVRKLMSAEDYNINLFELGVGFEKIFNVINGDE